MTKTTHLDGAVRLRTGVHSRSDVTGLQETLTVRGMPVTLRLPIRSAGRPLIMRGGSQFGLRGQDWGYSNSADAVTIRSIGFTIDSGGDREFDGAEFVEVVTEFDRMVADLWWWLTIPALEIPDMVDSLPAVSWANPDADLAMYSGLWDSHFTDTAVTHDQASWKHAIGHVRAADSPPMFARLILSAKENLSRGDFRPAVLDSATAIESVLNESIEDKLRIMDPSESLRKLILKRKTLGAIVDIANELGVPCPAGMNDNLVAPRNKVMHKGTEISREVAKLAVDTASQGVEQLRFQLQANCATCETIGASQTAN